MKNIIFISLLAIVAMFACKKKEDTASPNITIYTPTSGQMMHFDSVFINFKVEDEDLHEVGFTITRSSDDSILYEMPETHIHDNPYVYMDTLIVPVPGHTDTKINVSATDHNENASNKTISFHIHPM